MMPARRTFIASFGVWLFGKSFIGRAQPQKPYRIAVLGFASPSTYARQVEAFRSGLRDLGYIEGKNVVVDFRWAEGDATRLPELAADLVRLHPDVLVTSGPGTAVAKRVTSTIPIVMAVSLNAVEVGLIASLARPGGNVTGSTSFHRELCLKRLEWLRETFPRMRRVGLLVHSAGASKLALVQAMEDATRSFKLQLHVVEIGSSADFDLAFASLGKARLDGLVVSEHTLLVAEAARISRWATTIRLPVIGFVEIADTGGLLAYGVDFPDLWRRSATFVDKILKGAKPVDLPVQQPTRFEYVVNLKAANDLGVTIPQSVRLRADRVIE